MSKLPSNATRVFTGKFFEVWQWEQTMFDGSTKIFEKLKRPNTAEVIALVGEKILLQTEQQPQMPQPVSSIPGGKVDEGEDPLAAAKRELLEETGYVSDDWVLWSAISPIFKIEWTVFTYIARNCRQVQAATPDVGEKIETRLVDFDEFLKIATEDPLFYSPEIVPDLLRARLDPKKLDEFKRLLFGDNHSNTSNT